VKVLNPSRRDALATTFALLAVASLGLIVIATVVSMRSEVRSLLAIAGLGAYAYFSGRAMQLWQGRGHPSLHRRQWRRRFLADGSDAVVCLPKSVRGTSEFRAENVRRQSRRVS
jgi:hypothetical protein